MSRKSGVPGAAEQRTLHRAGHLHGSSLLRELNSQLIVALGDVPSHFSEVGFGYVLTLGKESATCQLLTACAQVQIIQRTVN
jgi:hypothetical protein